MTYQLLLSAEMPEDTSGDMSTHASGIMQLCIIRSFCIRYCVLVVRHVAGRGPAVRQPLDCHGNRRSPCVWLISMTQARHHGLTSPSFLSFAPALSRYCSLSLSPPPKSGSNGSVESGSVWDADREMESVSAPWLRLVLPVCSVYLKKGSELVKTQDHDTTAATVIVYISYRRDSSKRYSATLKNLSFFERH